MLNEMIQRQGELEAKLGYNFFEMTDEERTAYIKEHSTFLALEVSEMLEELPYLKPWKDYTGMSETEKDLAFAKASKEYIDVVHFVLAIGLALGFDATSIYNMYTKKNKANLVRQAEGYTFDKRHLDD